MHKTLKIIASLCATIFVVIYFCANHASENPESWAAPFKDTFPVGLAFGIAAIFFTVVSRSSKKKDLSSK